MNRHLETSDAYYDARTSSISEKLKDHVEELSDKPITYIDDDYLNLLRLVTGQYAERQATDPPEGDRNGGVTHSLICEGQQPNTDLQNDDGGDVQQKRIQCTEIDRDYAVLVANARSYEGEDDYHNGDQLSLRHWLSDEIGDEQVAHRHVRTMNVRPRGSTMQHSAAVEMEPGKKTLGGVEKGKNIVAETETETYDHKGKSPLKPEKQRVEDDGLASLAEYVIDSLGEHCGVL